VHQDVAVVHRTSCSTFGILLQGAGSPADNARAIRRVNARGKPLKVAENGTKPKTALVGLHGFAVTSPRRSPRLISTGTMSHQHSFAVGVAITWAIL
jgi:hypothetical protein